MKKILLTIISAVFGITALMTPAFAATVSLSPININAVEGESFSVVIAVDPQSINNYTAKIALDYPADVIEIKSFVLENGWMAMTQSGYDLVDNTNGALIKTAGYPGGISSATTFGTVSFLAKKTGNGTIKVGDEAFVFDANSQNVLSGNPSVSVAIAATVAQEPVVQEPAAETPEVTTLTETTPSEEVVSEQPSEEVNEEPVSEQPIEPMVQASFLTIAGDVLSLGTDNTSISVLMLIIILGIIVYAVYTLVQRKRNK